MVKSKVKKAKRKYVKKDLKYWKSGITRVRNARSQIKKKVASKKKGSR
jgi:hypothetical protein